MGYWSEANIGGSGGDSVYIFWITMNHGWNIFSITNLLACLGYEFMTLGQLFHDLDAANIYFFSDRGLH